MYQITDKIATHGIGQDSYPSTKAEEGYFEKTDYWLVDVRDILDEIQPVEVYKNKIDYAVSCLEKHKKIVICCGHGESRSNAIAMGVLMKHYHMDFSAAYQLVKQRVPICEIEPCHLQALKQVFLNR